MEITLSLPLAEFDPYMEGWMQAKNTTILILNSILVKWLMRFMNLLFQLSNKSIWNFH